MPTTNRNRAFDIADWKDEARVDALCVELLKEFHHHLGEEKKLEPIEAGELARGADYFLREFVIGDRQDNLLELAPQRVRQFAGHWYIVRTLEPNMTELSAILSGVAAFYAWADASGRVEHWRCLQITTHCQALAEYSKRIDSFWEIRDDGFIAWQNSCPLTDDADSEEAP